MPDKANLILGPIIGGLSHERVNLWARADRPAALHAWLATRRDLNDAKRAGKQLLTAASGCTGAILVEKLKPGTTYYYALTLEPRATPPKSAFRSFKTFPSPGRRKSVRFAFGSCFRPNKTDAGEAFRHIHEHAGPLSFMILEGDQIYADEFEYNSLGRVALNLEEYRAVYRHTWQNGHLRELMSRTPLFMTLDDHEVDNDWRWLDFEYTRPTIPFYTRWIRWFQGRSRNERRLTLERTRAAMQAYHEHQVMHAPPLLLPDGTQAYTFEYGACAFFVMDTRSRRVISRKGRSMLGESQFLALTGWLTRVRDQYPVKFIVTSTSFLSHLHLDVTNDRWSGFEVEQDRLLRHLTREGIQGVYFLAGDLHSAHAISAEVYEAGHTPVSVWEFCSSPFEQQPFTLAKYLDHPADSPYLRRQKRHFVIAEINYGVVDVLFAPDGPPVVKFEVVYNEQGVWKSRSIVGEAYAPVR